MKENDVYIAGEGDEIVEFDGIKYAVKEPWKQSDDGRTWLAFAVIVGEEKTDGMYFPAVELEAFRLEEGSFDIIGCMGPELFDENGGGVGMLCWSSEKGFTQER